MKHCHCLPGEPGSWSPSLENRGGTPDPLHCLQQQILGERKKAQGGEKAEACVSVLRACWTRACLSRGAQEPCPGAVACGSGSNPALVSRAQLGVPGGEEQFHVQLELQRESRGRRGLITSAGPGPRPPRFKHLSITGEARRVLIGIIPQLFGTSWCVVLAVSGCSGPGGAVWGALRLFWKAGESQWPGQLVRPPCGAWGSVLACW